MPQVKLIHQVLPIIVVTAIIFFGMIMGPNLWGLKSIPLEMVFFLAATYTVGQLLFMGYDWVEIQGAIVRKLSKGFPVVLILFAIGIIIGSWIVSGTIPMLVYYGIKLIHPNYI